jgi:hypothetical protein
MSRTKGIPAARWGTPGHDGGGLEAGIFITAVDFVGDYPGVLEPGYSWPFPAFFTFH